MPAGLSRRPLEDLQRRLEEKSASRPRARPQPIGEPLNLLPYARVRAEGLVYCSKELTTELQSGVGIDLDIYCAQLLRATSGIEQKGDCHAPVELARRRCILRDRQMKGADAREAYHTVHFQR